MSEFLANPNSENQAIEELSIHLLEPPHLRKVRKVDRDAPARWETMGGEAASFAFFEDAAPFLNLM